MKSAHFLVLGLMVLFLSSVALRAEDWTTADGKVYKDVKVIKTEPDAVTITHHDGGALVPLAKLSPDVQKRFNYDPAKAKAAADARAQADAKNAVALQAEFDQAQVKRKLDLIASDPRIRYGTLQPTGPILISPKPISPTSPETATMDTIAPDTTPADPTVTTTETGPDIAPIQYNNGSSANSDSTCVSVPSNVADTSPDSPDAVPASNHHSMSDLVDINTKLKDDHYSPNRHTASSLLLASSYLLPDPLDPSHHSTGELVKSASVLIPPPSDTGNRHSMDSLFGNDSLKRP